jgi:hypothetical protein
MEADIMLYNAFWESGIGNPQRKVKCRICGEKVKEAFPVDCLLSNGYWINICWFCYKHTVEDLKKWFNEHFDYKEAINEKDVGSNHADDGLYRLYKELTEKHE